MKAGEEKLLDIIKKEVQFKVPIYQRLYDWRIEHCQTLMEDIERLLRNPKIPIHFMGSIVYIDEKGQSRIGSTKELLVIDGQQRITTFALIFIILARFAKEKDKSVELARKIRNTCLENEYSKLENKNKLILTKRDNEVLEKLLRGEDFDYNDILSGNTSNLVINYVFLKQKIEELLTDFSVEQIYDNLNKIMVVDVCLFHDIDNPQQIFESLNATGKSLTDGDLIRNFILMNMTNDNQIKIYSSYWYPMESILGDFLTYFLINYLYVKKGTSTNIKNLYKEFKTFFYNNYVQETEKLASELLKYARYYIAIRDLKDENPLVNNALNRLNKLGISSHYPLMLNIFNEYKEGKLEAIDLVTLIEVIESFLFRRAICNVPTNSLNPIFRTMWNKLDKNNLTTSVIQELRSGEGNKKWPNDNDFREVLTSNSLYWNSFVKLLLEELEKHNNKEANKDFSSLTVEHILPQTSDDAEKLSDDWKKMLGPNYKEIRDKWVHTLGNLTLTGYNSEYSDKSFEEKKNMKNGFVESGLRLNKQISEYSVWNEESIKDRAKKLAEIAIERWRFFS